MAGSSTNTIDEMRISAREIAVSIRNNGSLAEEHRIEHVRREIKGLATRTGQMYATASDAVYDALVSFDGTDADLLAQYTKRFPVPSAGK